MPSSSGRDPSASRKSSRAPRPPCPNSAGSSVRILRHERSTHLQPRRPDRISELLRSRARQPRDLRAPLRGDDPRRRARLSVPPVSLAEPPGPASDQPYPHRHKSKRPGYPVLPCVSRRVRDRPHTIPVRVESRAVEALNLPAPACEFQGCSRAAGGSGTVTARNDGRGRCFITVPTVGSSLRLSRSDSPLRSWETTTRRVDKTCVGPWGLRNPSRGGALRRS